MNVLEQHELITVDMDEDANELYLDQKGRMPFEVGQTGTVVYDSDKITISTLGRTMEAVATVINIMDSSRKVIVELEDGCQMTLEYHEFLRRGEWCYAIDEENYIEYKGPQRGSAIWTMPPMSKTLTTVTAVLRKLSSTSHPPMKTARG